MTGHWCLHHVSPASRAPSSIATETGFHLRASPLVRRRLALAPLCGAPHSGANAPSKGCAPWRATWPAGRACRHTRRRSPVFWIGGRRVPDRHRSTTLQANAAMRSIDRRATRESHEFVRRFAEASGCRRRRARSWHTRPGHEGRSDAPGPHGRARAPALYAQAGSPDVCPRIRARPNCQVLRSDTRVCLLSSRPH